MRTGLLLSALLALVAVACASTAADGDAESEDSIIGGAAAPEASWDAVGALVEIHEMAMQGGVMKMRALPALELPAGKAVELKPGGHHVMLFDLKQQIKAGDSVPLTLVVVDPGGKRRTVEVSAAVRPLGGH